MKHTLHFYGLVKDAGSIDKMKKIIYSFINYYGAFIIYIYIMNIRMYLKKG